MYCVLLCIHVQAKSKPTVYVLVFAVLNFLGSIHERWHLYPGISIITYHSFDTNIASHFQLCLVVKPHLCCFYSETWDASSSVNAQRFTPILTLSWDMACRHGHRITSLASQGDLLSDK